MGLERVGNALRENGQAEDALPVCEAALALNRRYWSHDEGAVIGAQANLASCLDDMGQHNKALVLKREIYTRTVAACGGSDENSLMAGSNLAISLGMAGLLDQSKTLVRDQLLPVARRSLGSDHDVTLRLSQSLATALQNGYRTREDLRLNQSAASTRLEL